MQNKRLRGFLQNLALVLLSLSALFLLGSMPLFHISWTDQVQSLLAPHPASGGHAQSSTLADMFPSVHVMVTQDIEYRRYGRLYVPGDDPLLEQIIPLFQEALGSASETGASAELTLRSALDSPCLYLDLTTQLPLEAVAAWLGETVGFSREVRSMALTSEQEDTATLYLRSESGDIFRYNTALPVSAVREVCGSQTSNGSIFAYESNYAPLAPYTVLVAETPDAPAVQTELPAAYSVYNLLTALDFNAHPLFRYTESSGAEVVEESPRTLRVSPDGAVSFTSRGEDSSPLYQVPAAGEQPTMPECLSAAGRLAAALTEGTGASPLYLRAVEMAEGGCTVRFGYHAGAIPVFFSDEKDALSVTISGAAITAFTYRCRAYTPTEDTSPLLPAAMAQAIASLYPEAGLSVGYVDGGAGPLAAHWLAG